MKISPKAIYVTVAPIIAAALIALITGDSQWLVAALLGIVAGGAAVAAPPAPGVSQKAVAKLAKRKRGI